MLMGLLCLALPSALRAASFTASLDRDTITMGESATLTLTFEGGSPKAMPMPPSLPTLRIQDAGVDSRNVSIVNGQVSSTSSHTFSVTPLQMGTFLIPAMSVDIGGQTCNSEPVKLTVVQSTTPPPSPKTAFLKLAVPKNQVYIGEVLPVEIYLYFQAVQGVEMPHFKEEGFTLGKMLQPTQSTAAVNGQQYNVAILKTYVIPVKVGQLDLGPATMTMNVPKPNSRRNIFQQPVDWESVTVESEPQTLQVLPLPRENVPPGFSGAVGSFTLNATVNPTNVAVGDPITIKVQVAGHGALESVTLPNQTNWQQFKVYPPTSDFQATDPLGISGTKTFALTAVPENLELKELPPFVFSFFDPAQKSYRTLTQPAVSLVVRPSAASLPPPSLSNANNASENSTANQDLTHIKPRLGLVAQLQPPLVQQPWFLALQGLPLLVWLSLLIRRKQAEKLARNPHLQRQRQVGQMVRNGLKELRQFADANQPEAFFATVFRLLQEQLGERLDLPASAITEAVLEERLRPRRVPDEQLALLHELFQTCNQARYAPQSTNAELVSLVPKVESALNDLQKIKA